MKQSKHSKKSQINNEESNIMKRMLVRGLQVVIIISAVLLLVCTLLPQIFLNTADSPISWIEHSAWPYLSLLAFVLSMLMPVVVLAIYTSQIEETGILGLIGFSLLLIVMAAYLGIQFDMAFVWPVLAERAPELIDFSGPMFRHPHFAFVHFWMGPIHTIGTLLFGIALIKARVFPRVTSILFIIGMVLSAGVLFPPFLLRTLGGVIGSLALTWIAFFLWNRTKQEPTNT